MRHFPFVFRDVANHVFNQCVGQTLPSNVKSVREIRQFLKPYSAFLLTKWEQDEKPSIYRHPWYPLELLLCYTWPTYYSVKSTLQFFKTHGIDWKNFDVLDEYNGIGLSSIQMMNSGLKKPITMLTAHVDLVRQLCEGFSNSQNYRIITEIDHQKEYDLIMSYEVVEHFEDPMLWLHDILGQLKTNGYLSFSHGFGVPAIGHHGSYNRFSLTDLPDHRGGFIGGKAYWSRFRKVLLKEFDLVYYRYHNKPMIWRKK